MWHRKSVEKYFCVKLKNCEKTTLGTISQFLDHFAVPYMTVVSLLNIWRFIISRASWHRSNESPWFFFKFQKVCQTVSQDQKYAKVSHRTKSMLWQTVSQLVQRDVLPPKYQWIINSRERPSLASRDEIRHLFPWLAYV